MLQVRQLFQIRTNYYDSKPIIINHYLFVTQSLIINNGTLFIIHKI